LSPRTYGFVNPKPSTPTTSTSPSATKTAASRRGQLLAHTSVKYDISHRILRFGEVFEDPTIVTARTTLQLGTAVAESARQAMEEIRSRINDDIVRKLTEYAPSLPSEDVEVIRPFVADSIALALPLTAYSVETLLGPVMKFVHWAVFVVGCELDALIIFDRELIETYVREVLPKELAPGTRRNYRAWIFRVAEVVNPNKNPRLPMPLNQKDMGTPYVESDIVGLDRWAAGQSTPYRRSNAATLVALGAGAGLSSIEIVHLTRNAVTVRADGSVELTVVVDGIFKRKVIVSAEFEDIITTQVADLEPDVFVFLPRRNRTENDVVSAFVAKTLHPRGTPTVTVRRLRNTWLVTQMVNRVDVLTLMEAAGLQSLESISRLAKFVPRPTADQRDAQLRGTL
jgi:hypothetical protein